MIDNTEAIIEDAVVANEPQIEKRTRSWLCAFKLHRRTRWSKPFSRKAINTVFSVFGGPSGASEGLYWYQLRECLGCGEREERSV